MRHDTLRPRAPSMTDERADVSPQVAYLERKLERSEWQREQLEREQQNNERMLAGTIDELRRVRAKLDERSADLLRINGELERARNEALNASRAKSDFIASTSHELRTPLNAIIGYTELLQEEDEGMTLKQAAPDLSRIESSARHLLSLINDILDLSKIEAGHMEMCPERFDLEPMLMHCASTVAPLIDSARVELRTDFDDTLGELHTDQMRLRQVVINILSNAAKFTKRGHITLRARLHDGGDRVVLSVIDTGVGITQAFRDKLFTPFVQSEETRDQHAFGTGLGLSLTKRLCELLGGSIEVQSEPGEGSTFTIDLPVCLPPEAPVAQACKEEATQGVERA